MTNLMKRESKFEWSEKCEEDFQILKECLTSAPVLTLPDGNEGFEVYSDASKNCLGVCVAGEWEGQLKKLDSKTPHLYVKKIEFACNYFATFKNMPHSRKMDVMPEMIVYYLPHGTSYIELKHKFSDMHFEDDTPN
ncbi:uncharacterized protein [Spinacia oleracea]|uniref:Reverse transcriptase/retrotransposon-derived protein RNase H-like domain-containing protein n=1 Tax=Spinacia oleracea TaxID=3562 RepID=A0ABM3R3N5_SPIOL|nr:uncharacterized protein LOC130465478 [Spinacia oleracea]